MQETNARINNVNKMLSKYTSGQGFGKLNSDKLSKFRSKHLGSNKGNPKIKKAKTETGKPVRVKGKIGAVKEEKKRKLRKLGGLKAVKQKVFKGRAFQSSKLGWFGIGLEFI